MTLGSPVGWASARCWAGCRCCCCHCSGPPHCRNCAHVCDCCCWSGDAGCRVCVQHWTGAERMTSELRSPVPSALHQRCCWCCLSRNHCFHFRNCCSPCWRDWSCQCCDGRNRQKSRCRCGFESLPPRWVEQTLLCCRFRKTVLIREISFSCNFKAAR